MESLGNYETNKMSTLTKSKYVSKVDSTNPFSVNSAGEKCGEMLTTVDNSGQFQHFWTLVTIVALLFNASKWAEFDWAWEDVKKNEWVDSYSCALHVIREPVRDRMSDLPRVRPSRSAYSVFTPSSLLVHSPSSLATNPLYWKAVSDNSCFAPHPGSVPNPRKLT